MLIMFINVMWYYVLKLIFVKILRVIVNIFEFVSSEWLVSGLKNLLSIK